MDQRNLALEAIQKKLVGKTLTYKEIFAVMDQISKEKLGDVLTTYFVASGYSKGFTSDELYFLTKAMVETGEQLEFKGIVADKHSIGGTPGARTTMIVVPIVAAAGFKIPKSSSRAITTPAGTADSMEALSRVKFDKKEIYKIVKKTNACIVWGGSFKIAPADDEIIRIEEPLMFESFDKILVSVMAKKVAFGSNHVVIEIPYGSSVKVHKLEDAKVLGSKFEELARKFGMELKTVVHKVDEPAGQGIGPLLEARDALKVLEQTKDRPLALEERALGLAEVLLEICLQDSPKSKKEFVKMHFENTGEWAKDILQSGAALAIMKEIIAAQKGNPKITSSKLHPSKEERNFTSDTKGKVVSVNNKNISLIAKILGAPHDKGAGLFLYKRIGDKVEKNELLFTFYSDSKYKITEARDSLKLLPIYDIES